jgi:hypothetical protein
MIPSLPKGDGLRPPLSVRTWQVMLVTQDTGHCKGIGQGEPCPLLVCQRMQIRHRRLLGFLSAPESQGEEGRVWSRAGREDLGLRGRKNRRVERTGWVHQSARESGRRKMEEGKKGKGG